MVDEGEVRRVRDLIRPDVQAALDAAYGEYARHLLGEGGTPYWLRSDLPASWKQVLRRDVPSVRVMTDHLAREVVRHFEVVPVDGAERDNLFTYCVFPGIERIRGTLPALSVECQVSLHRGEPTGVRCFFAKNTDVEPSSWEDGVPWGWSCSEGREVVLRTEEGGNPVVDR